MNFYLNLQFDKYKSESEQNILQLYLFSKFCGHGVIMSKSLLDHVRENNLNEVSEDEDHLRTGYKMLRKF